jgi:hypothetical protein
MVTGPSFHGDRPGMQGFLNDMHRFCIMMPRNFLFTSGSDRAHHSYAQHASRHLRTNRNDWRGNRHLGIGSCLSVDLDSEYHCTETSFIIQGISRTESGSSTSLRGDHRATALPYHQGRRLEDETATTHRVIDAGTVDASTWRPLRQSLAHAQSATGVDSNWRLPRTMARW